MSIIKKDGIILRHIHGTYFLIDVKCNYLNDKCYLYELNEIGAFIWENIDKYNTVLRLAHYLHSQIVGDVEIEEIASDIESYINALENEGFIYVED